MNKQIIFVDPSVQDYQSLIQDTDRAQIFILNENLSARDRVNYQCLSHSKRHIAFLTKVRYNNSND